LQIAAAAAAAAAETSHLAAAAAAAEVASRDLAYHWQPLPGCLLLLLHVVAAPSSVGNQA
jgi:hypothetical protein